MCGFKAQIAGNSGPIAYKDVGKDREQERKLCNAEAEHFKPMMRVHDLIRGSLRDGRP